MKHLDHLNPEQKQAVLHTEGPLLILAGAGAGKTKTITHRILNLIQSGVAPHQILAITFTNKAAREMRERVHALLGGDPDLNRPISFTERPFVSTFHSLGVHILKESGSVLGIPRHFSIYDKNDSKQAIKEGLLGAGLDPKQYEPQKILGVISREKGGGVTLEQFADRVHDYFSEIVFSVWQRYEVILKKEKALDFDDLLLKTATLLTKHPDVLEHYQNVWRYIHIDEYQDTNKVQYEIAHALAAKYKNICVVGDIDQTIYTWRGATIKNILNFEKDYPTATRILLEKNYRSTKTILAVANSIIDLNTNRVKKTLYTDNAVGDKIGLYPAYDETDEAYFVAEKAKKLIASGTRAKEIAVLYRANFQSRILEEAFLSTQTPYQLIGTRFFDRREIKDLLSYIRAALNEDSLSDIKRIINTPPRGIGKVTLAKIFGGQEHTLSPAIQGRIASFRGILKSIREKALTDKPSETIKFALRLTGIEEHLRTGSEEDNERLENLKELVSVALRYDPEPLGVGIEKLIEDASLGSDQDEIKEDKDAARLMTVHASKGLEFDYVFIVGLEQDLFPHRHMAGKGRDENEEERRLFYVALTRARKKLFLCYASFRTIFGSQQINLPSEFITDIDELHLETEEKTERPRGKVIFFEDF